MKNLKASLLVVQTYPELENVEFLSKGQDFHDTDLAHKTGYVYAFKDGQIYELSLSKEYCKLVYDLRDYYEGLSPPKVVGFAFNYVTNSLVLSVENGDLLAIGLDPECLDGKCICVVEIGISAMEWSPDQENVLLSTGSDNSLLLMSSAFDVLNEIFLNEPGEGEQQFINVGWGRKETQFHGSEGKGAAIAPTPDVASPSYSKSHNLTITWRGDSALFAVGYWCPKDSMRRVKIFDKDGILQCLSESLPGLEEPMAWRPSGNLIGLTQTLPNKYIITFMEKNGLKHGEFILPPDIKVNKLIWNADSSILGMLALDKTSGQESLMLWTTGNYHWYLKQKLVLESTPVCLLWDDTRGNRMHGVYINGSCFTIEWTWIINHTDGYHPTDPAYVAVIDHDKVLLTSFKEAIIPPPMSGWSLSCPSAVNQVLFLKENHSACQKDMLPICAILHNDEVAFFTKSASDFICNRTFKISWADKSFLLPLSLSHWLWLSERTFLLCMTVEKHFSMIYLLDLTEEELVVRNFLETEGVIISCSSIGGEVLLQTSNGKLYLFDVDSCTVSIHNIVLQEPCFKMEFTKNGIFSLSELNRMYINNVQISSSVNSFLFHKPYLIATTTHHTLIVVNPDLREEISLRKLERGSKLVVATGNSVVMQLPRGNLETIQPRALTILTAGQLLNDKKYNEVMTLLRRQRIDLNLCVDHNSQQFIRDIDEFISQVDPQWITLFITELSRYVVTKNAYSSYYDQKVDDNQQKIDKGKVEAICSSLYDAMVKADKEYFLLPILSCLVKMKKMKEAIELCNTDTALKHLLFLVDVDILYTEALGAYNLEAALKIAGKSQKDPKEYLPFLNSLRVMDPNYMKYTIDKSLGRFGSALVHIAKCPEEDKSDLCFQLIREHSLYFKALDIFRNHKERYNDVSLLYSDYLYKCKHYEEAGIMYERYGNYAKAIQAFLEIGQWRQCMLLANRLKYDENNLKKLAVLICNKLYSRQEYSEAGYIYITYLTDVERSVESYAKGKKWQEAIYTAESSGALELKESVIKNGLMESLENLKEDIKSKMESIQKHVNRLLVIREDKLKKNDINYIDEISDTQSEASSVSTMRSSMSRSSKNTRKMQRKMWSLKEGNPREEQALIARLAQLIQSSEKLTGEVRSTCLTLLYFMEDDEALHLQLDLKSLLLLIEKNKPSIWVRENDETIDPLDEQLKFPPTSNIQLGWEVETLKEGT